MWVDAALDYGYFSKELENVNGSLSVNLRLQGRNSMMKWVRRSRLVTRVQVRYG